MKREIFQSLTMVGNTLALVLTGCGDDDKDTPEGDQAASGAPVAGFSDAVAKLPTHTSLTDIAHLADYDAGGVHIDMGTPADAKYIVGGWKKNWGSRGTDNNTCGGASST